MGMKTDMDTRFTILVTGASGYIGSRLCRLALERGLGLVMMGRRRPPSVSERDVVFHAFDLGDEAPATAFDGVQAVVHLAQAGLDSGSDGSLNVEGSRRVIEAGRRAGVERFIFVSSQSARADAPATYGRNKWRVEELLDRDGEVVVRPGMVYGGEPRGVYGTICRLAGVGPVLPLVGGDAPIQLIHVDELCHALLKIAATTTQPRRVYALGAVRAMSFRRVVRLIARARDGRRLRTFTVPLTAALALAAMGEALARVIPKLPVVARERILGLVDVRVADTEASLTALHMTLGDPVTLLAGEGRDVRRRQLAEGRTLLTYVRGRPPSPMMVRRYVRAMSALGLNLPLALPAVASRMPRLLRLWEPMGARSSELMDRLAIAAAIAEASPEGARMFLALEERSAAVVALLTGWTLLWLAVTEILVLPFRLLLGRGES